MNPKAHIFSNVFAAVSSGFAIAAWQEQLDWSLRIAASVVAIIAGLIAIHDWFKRRRQKHVARST
jgi:hypothetical protein